MSMRRPGTLAWASLLLLPGLAHGAPVYSLTPIDYGDPALSVIPMSINDRGDVAGYVASFTPGSLIPARPFAWYGSGPARALPVPANTPDYAYAFAINNRGEVLGEIGSDTVIWSPDGSVRTLAPPAGHTPGYPVDLNDAEVLNFGTLRRADGSVEDLLGFSGAAISPAGKILGQGPDGPVVWERDGTVRLLPLTGYEYGHGYDINDAGWVAGMVGINDVNSLAVWRPDGTLIVGSAGVRDHYGAQGEGINNLGEVVGSSLDRAVYWSETEGLVDLQTRLDASGAGWTLASAMGINDAGQIIATASRVGGSHTYSVVLTPVPEPSGALGCLAVPAVMVSRRRRGTKF